MFRPALRWAHEGVVVVSALATLGVCLGAVHAQPGMPPRMPGPGNPPGMNPRMPGMNGPVIKTVWRCSGCGHEIGDGAFPPAQCPFCGAKIVNGIGPAQPGYGGGNPGAMNPGGMPPANNPGGFPLGNMPGAVPPANNPAAPPAGNNPQFQPVVPPVANDPPPVNGNVPDRSLQRDVVSSSPGSGSGVRIAAVVLLVLAALLVGLVLVVVAVIVIYNVSGAGRKASRPARRRRLAEQY